jgi:hypothetical protein
MSTEYNREAGHVTKYDRWDVKVSKYGVYKANLLGFRPDDIYHARTGGLRRAGDDRGISTHRVDSGDPSQLYLQLSDLEHGVRGRRG